jgi:hypothetical protein
LKDAIDSYNPDDLAASTARIRAEHNSITSVDTLTAIYSEAIRMFDSAAVPVNEFHSYLERLAREADQLWSESHGIRSELAALNSEITALKNSTSWRWTAPFRAVSSILRRG